MNGKNFFSLRLGSEVIFFEYDFESSQLKEVGTWKMPDPNVNYYYFSHKNQFIYYGFENAKTSYGDIGVYDITTQKTYLI
jgi:hypothetical protein